MKCRKCRRETPDGSNYCIVCGAKQNIEKHRKARGNGNGTAVKRGKTWRAVWTVETYLAENNKLVQKRKTKDGFATKTAALAYASAPPSDVKKVPTLRSYWESYKATSYLDLSKSKQTAFRIAWGKLESIAGKKMDELTINDLQMCIDSEASTYYPARDIKTILSHMYKCAVAEGNARTNLADFIRLPPLEEKELQPFSEDELRMLWDAYGNGDNFVGYILLMIYSGMMPGELIGLKKEMIDWEKYEIRGCGLKTKKRKEVPIVFPEMIGPVLQSLIENSKSSVGYVLGMNRDNFYTEYHEAVKRAGVRDLPPYSCRHTTATALALGNIAPSVIQEVMRHTKFSTTQRYIHPDSASAHTAVNTMSKGKES